jgi:hypothetical protein
MSSELSGAVAGKTELITPKKTTTNTIAKTMKALVYGGPGIIELKNIPVPTIVKPTDAFCIAWYYAGT